LHGGLSSGQSSAFYCIGGGRRSGFREKGLDRLCAFWSTYAHIYARQIMPNSHEAQAERREAIRRLLSEGPADTQKSVVAALLAQGFEATQSSVSRDLRELGAIKSASGYELATSLENSDDEVAQVADLLRDLTPAGPNLLVVKTAIGAAQRVALALDRSGWPEIVGNVGGDDTVFTATASAAAQRNLLARIDRATARA
jgi:transcriptional regulator of arginine metabolism